MKINPIAYGFIVLIVFFGIILGFQSAGIWSTSGKVDSSGKAIQPSGTDPSTIKGWMTLDQIGNTYNIPLEEILAQFNLPAETPATTALKDLESDTFDTSILILWLQNRGPSGEIQPTDVISSAPTLSVTSTPISTDIETTVPTEYVILERTITGKTTFQDLIDWGVSIDVIKKIIGGELPTPPVIIKDYVTGKGLEFAGIKSLLQTEVDQVK
jgi:hypothetical protein